MRFGSIVIAFVAACAGDGGGDGNGSAGTSPSSQAGGGGASSGGAGMGMGTGGMRAATGSGGSGNASASGRNASASGGRGASGASGASAAAGRSGAGGGTSTAGGGGASGTLDHFSFFVTSLETMRKLSGSQDGFGGDLRHGEADGLTGADKICTETAEASMPGSGAKGWRAFLSVAQGPSGGAVHAIERIGKGPWYDRLGRLVAMNAQALMNDRPMGADAAIAEDLPNESGVPNHRPDPNQPAVDNHHVLTGSDTSGRLYNNNASGTCSNWTSRDQAAGRPRVGFSWVADNRRHWISGQDEGGCGAGVSLEEMGGSNPNNPIVGSGGGYGAIYCFALQP